MSVKKTSNESVKIRLVGQKMINCQVEPATFWDIFNKWGSSWMWESVDEKYKSQDINWLFEGMKEGTLLWCAYGSYKQKAAPFVSGTGWRVFCTKSGKKQ